MDNDIALTLGKRVKDGGLYSITQAERARHIYTIGRTGAGKSTFQRAIALQDIHAGRGLCLIDPHGENAAWLANAIPRHRINDTIYFDAADREYPIGLNPLADARASGDSELAASEILAMFKGLFRDSWGEWLEYLLKHTILALLERKQGAVSLLGIQRILEDEGYRMSVLRTLKDPALKRFWNEYINHLQERQLLERISSTINKTGKFELSKTLRNIVGQSKSGFSMKRVVDDGQILLVNLNKGQIGEDNANFLGALIVSMIIGQVMRRGAVPPEDRTQFNLIIDEFQNVTTDSFATIVSECRKYGLSLAVAHQTFDQVPPKTLDQILKNAEVLTAFGVSFEDADRLTSAFRPLRSEGLSDVSVGQFWSRTTVTNPELIVGFDPLTLKEFERHSRNRVLRCARTKYAKNRLPLEKGLNAWYKQKS